MAFNRDYRPGGGRSGGRDFGERRFGGDRGDRGGDREMFKTICSNCGKECEVPFKPTGSKPVYCRDCFRTMGGSDQRRNDDRGRAPSAPMAPSQPQYKEQFEALNAKLDKILKLLNPEKSNVAPIESVEPEKKKVKAKKIAKTEEIIDASVVIEEPAKTETPADTSTDSSENS